MAPSEDAIRPVGLAGSASTPIGAEIAAWARRGQEAEARDACERRVPGGFEADPGEPILVAGLRFGGAPAAEGDVGARADRFRPRDPHPQGPVGRTIGRRWREHARSRGAASGFDGAAGIASRPAPRHLGPMRSVS